MSSQNNIENSNHNIENLIHSLITKNDKFQDLIIKRLDKMEEDIKNIYNKNLSPRINRDNTTIKKINQLNSFSKQEGNLDPDTNVDSNSWGKSMNSGSFFSHNLKPYANKLPEKNEMIYETPENRQNKKKVQMRTEYCPVKRKSLLQDFDESVFGMEKNIQADSTNVNNN